MSVMLNSLRLVSCKVYCSRTDQITKYSESLSLLVLLSVVLFFYIMKGYADKGFVFKSEYSSVIGISYI